MSSQVLTWQDELSRLLARMKAVGLAPDIDSMDLSEQRAAYCVLRRLMQGRSTNNLRGGDE